MAPIPNRGDKRAFFDLEIGGEPAGRVVFSLWNYTCPKTVENFRNMCTGEMGELFGHRATYERSIFHRVIKGFMIQGGDITRRNGSGGFSIYGATFDDENLALKHNRPFLLSMANRGPDTNGSQFFITTEEVPHLDGKHCVFGEVIKGFDVVKRIENLETGENDVPTQKVQIVNCGEMVRKGDQRSSSKEDEPEIGGCKMDDEPRTYNWLMRWSRSPSPVGGVKKVRKSKRDRSPERRRRVSRERNGRERRSRSRSNDRHRRDDKKEERRPPVVSKDGVKVRGRGKLTFMGARTRSRTPPHWKKEESKKQTLSAHQKKLEEEEERKKRIAQRERLEAEHTARHEKERIEREAQRELDRQKKEARRELERQERKGSARRSSSSDSSSSEKSERSPSPYALSDPETPRRDRKQSRSPSPFPGKRSRRSADSDSD